MIRFIKHYLLLAACLMSQGVSAQGYHITGTCDQVKDGDKVFLCTMEGFFSMVPLDSTVVRNGKFEFRGEYDGAVMRFICPMRGTENVGMTTIILENAEISVKVGKNGKDQVKGGPSTALYQEYENGVNALYPPHMSDLWNAENDSTKTEAERKAAKAKLEEINRKVGDYKYNFVMNHIPSPVSDMIFLGIQRDITEEQFNAIVDKMEKSGRTYVNYKQYQEELAIQKATALGEKYTDLALNDPDGNLVKVSDYVDKNRYTMIDFWASWCGPCLKEMPWVVKAYEQFHDKGFEVVGVSLDNNKEAWVKAIAKFNMPWPHMSDLKGWACAAAKPYNIKGIPANVVIDRNGTIVAKNLREQELLDKLAELFR